MWTRLVMCIFWCNLFKHFAGYAHCGQVCFLHFLVQSFQTFCSFCGLWTGLLFCIFGAIFSKNLQFPRIVDRFAFLHFLVQSFQMLYIFCALWTGLVLCIFCCNLFKCCAGSAHCGQVWFCAFFGAIALGSSLNQVRVAFGNSSLDLKSCIQRKSKVLITNMTSILSLLTEPL